MALRKLVLAQIWGALDGSPFTPLDFIVETAGRNSLLEVTFRHDPAFRFLVKKSGNPNLSVTLSPGSHEDQEYCQIPHDAIPQALLNWTYNIRDELRTTVPIYAAVDDLKEALDQHIREHVENPQSPFSRAEADDIRTKLDELSKKFEEMRERQELTEQEVARLNREIEGMKEDLPTYPKGVWYKTAANKLWVAVSTVATSKESRQVLAKAAQRLLGLDG